MKYHSRVSEREEYLPVVVALMGAPGTKSSFSAFCLLEQNRYSLTIISGTDMALIGAAQRILKFAGRPTRVFTGKRIFLRK